MTNPKHEEIFKHRNSQNPSGPVDKPKNKKHVAGIDDDTRVVYSEENNRDDG